MAMSTTYAHPMRSMITLSAVASLLVVLEAGCSSSSPCALPCGAIGATFNLSCNSNDLTSVVASGPCSMPDASLSWYTGTGSQGTVTVYSSSPGTCHVQLSFASGFTFSTDVTFISQTEGTCGSCPSFTEPSSGEFTVDNPASTCVAVPDAGGDDGGVEATARDAEAGG